MRILLIILCLLPSLAFTITIDMDIIKKLESSGNPFAVHTRTNAIGLYQITPICLKDYNICNRTDFKWYHLFNEELNFKVAEWYFTKRIPELLDTYNQAHTLDNILCSYNAGINLVLKKYMPMETKFYIRRYKLLYNLKVGYNAYN